jgi:hypothetical protein
MSRASETAEVIVDALQEAGYDAKARGGTVLVERGKRAEFTVVDKGAVVIDHEREPDEVEHLLKESRLSRAIKIRGKLYNVHSLDVWGNEEDGFGVNVYSSSGTIEIPSGAKDADILRVLKEDGFIDPHIKLSDIEIEGDEYELHVSDSRNSQPVYQLRPR